ncbi:MAG: hypothetical protein IKO49_01090 [Bacilli bacterium]|nr:hypothetical protein [Clostridia bacterium]MBR4617893.1 hypothetical protein [Bacilli bacterium]
MTCCIGYIAKNKMYFVGDTAGTDDDNVQETRRDSKVFKLNNILFATAGSFRMRDLLMYNLVIPRLGKDEDIDKYVRTKLINNIRKLFIDNGVCIKTDESDQVSPGEILIGIKNRLYKIESDFQVGEAIKHYNAIGAGSREALGALDMYGKYNNYPDDDIDIKLLIDNAIEVAAGRNATVNMITKYITKSIK